MAKKKTNKSKGDKTPPKIPYSYKPEKMTLEQWQIALRQQAAAKEPFAVTELNAKDYPGYYKIANPITRNEYKVVYRGEASPWNYCSCMDFKTSQLGTCKHIEAVKLWIEGHRKKVHREAPPYTSMYLSYKGERKVCLRIGTDHEEEFRQLAQSYFAPDGVLLPQAMPSIGKFLQEAMKIDNTFRWYSDALDFILEKQDYNYRNTIINYLPDEKLNELLRTPLYPYQREGIRFAFRAGKSIIADEMGLGKTIQAIGTAELMRKQGLISSALIICPTSLKYQWKKEIERFTGSSAIVVEGNHPTRNKLYHSEPFYKIVSYNSMSNDVKILHSLRTDLLIMDEVQRLKNWKTQISQSARRIDAQYAVVLSGTPLENKLEELYSITQFVDQYCLGPYYRFMDETVVTSDTGKVIGYKNLNEVGKKLKHILIRRRKRDVALQLPERMDKILFVPMTEEQRAMHDEFQASVAQLVFKWTRNRFLSENDRKRLLLFLSQMRMVCDSTYILDQKTRCDTKVGETMNILRNMLESGDEKAVVFSQWERMTRLIAAELDAMGIQYEYLHGGIPSQQRRLLTENFTENPDSRVFLSTDAGSTGLNLQAASILINIDLPWNPAVLEQRIARIYRIGQKKNIQVINLVASQTIEERMLGTLNFKSSLFEGILDNGEDAIFLEDSKFDKIMESLKVMTEPTAEQEKEPANVVSSDDTEETTETGTAGKADTPATNASVMSATDTDNTPATDEDAMSATNINNTPAAGEETPPQELVQQGMSFFSGLARTLQSPEATRRLVDSIVEVDEKTGETSLHIPVPDKESVANVLNMIGKLFGGK